MPPIKRVFHLLHKLNQCQPNGATSAPKKPTPQGPPYMVLQNPLSNQGVVETQPLVQQNTATTSSSQPIYPGVHHIMTLSSDVNLQTRRNQYGSTMETINPFVESTSTTLYMSLHLPRPPMDRTAKVPRFPLHRVTNNPTARAALNYSIVDEQLPTRL